MSDLEKFYSDHIDRIYTFCLYRTGNRFVAEDITSTTFLKFFKSDWQRYTQPVAYLYTVCRNSLIDHYRANKNHVSLEALLEKGSDVGATFDTDKRLLILDAHRAIEMLPEDQKEVILLQYVQDLDNKTICRILGKSEPAVKSLAYRGLATLRDKLNPKRNINSNIPHVIPARAGI